MTIEIYPDYPLKKLCDVRGCSHEKAQFQGRYSLVGYYYCPDCESKFDPQEFQREQQALKNIATYRQAEQVLKDYKICGNGGHGCGKVFKTEDTTRTIQYGQTYYWCNENCYDKIKDDW